MLHNFPLNNINDYTNTDNWKIKWPQSQVHHLMINQFNPNWCHYQFPISLRKQKFNHLIPLDLDSHHKHSVLLLILLQNMNLYCIS